MRGGDNTGTEEGYEPKCDHGPCTTSQCYFKENDSCYQIESTSRYILTTMLITISNSCLNSLFCIASQTTT